MASMRVYQLAKELEITSKDLLSHLRTQGVELASHMSALSDEQVSALKKHFSRKGGTPPTSPEPAAPAKPVEAKVVAPAPAAESKPVSEPVVVSQRPQSGGVGTKGPAESGASPKMAQPQPSSGGGTPPANNSGQRPSPEPSGSRPGGASQPQPAPSKGQAESHGYARYPQGGNRSQGQQQQGRPPGEQSRGGASHQKPAPPSPTERPPIRTVPLDRIFGPGKGRRPGGPAPSYPTHHQQEPSRSRSDEHSGSRVGGGGHEPRREFRDHHDRPRHDDRREGGPPRRQGGGPPFQGGDARRPSSSVQSRLGPPVGSQEQQQQQQQQRFERPERTDRPDRPAFDQRPPRSGAPFEPRRGTPDVGWVEEVDSTFGKDKKNRAERVQGKSKDSERINQFDDRESGDRRRGGGKLPDKKRATLFGGQSGKKGAPRKDFASPPPEVKELPVVEIPDLLSVKEFAELIGKGVNEVIKELFMMGQMMTANQTLNQELAAKVGSRLGYNVQVQMGREQFAEELSLSVDAEGQVLRPPVITVMGHVDHGKTSLLDAIRETEVAASEAGGITQHIGASVVHHNNQAVVFLDTPGHEAFTAMRSRGAQVTDIVVLVVAADDGVMPQTLEAIDHAKSAKVPILVAVNKIDKPGSDPQKIKTELARHGLNPEEWGGDTIYCEVSAKKKIGIEHLLDMLLLLSEMKELKANPEVKAHGTVIEAKLDKGRGPVATILVQSGTLSIGDAFVVGPIYGKVRAMYNDKGERLNDAGPSTPVEVLGLAAVPDAGDSFHVVDDEKEAKLISQRRLIEEKRKTLAQQSGRMKLEDLFSKIQEGEAKELNLILKADVQGSVEALADALSKLSHPKVKVQIVHRSVGTITESDVLLATTTNSIIVGYNVVPEPRIRKLAEEKEVEIRLHTIIYEVLDEIRNAMEGLLDPTFREEELGRAEVRNTFSVPKVGVIAGCMVTDGKVLRSANARLIRDGKIIWSGKLASLKRFKDDAREVAQGFECGIGLEGYGDVKVGDVILFYIIVKEKGSLD